MTLRAAAFGQVGRLVVVSVYQNRDSVSPMGMESGGLLKSSASKAGWRNPVSANHFVLEHDHKIQVEYTVGVTPGITALTYSDGNSPTVEFTGSQITADETALGTLVSVPLERSVDTGGERFGFFLPQLDVPRGESGHFETVGVYERFSGPDSIPQRPPSWRSIEFRGTAQTVIVPA
jgi:hypothetical protein